MTSLEHVLQPVIEEATPKFLQTDKGYSSEANREFLKTNNIGNGIMDKTKRNTKLTFKQLYRNKLLNAQTLQLKISLVLQKQVNWYSQS